MGLIGLAVGAVAGFLVNLISTWIETHDSTRGFAIDWSRALVFAALMGLVTAAIWILTVRHRRKAFKGAGRAASGSAERAMTGESR
ncbi:hypothetical protein ACLQ2R_08300 [Streptosporangium sp. DT93]|uniref:hypothetical protein n=1 Tax=Streptosporangium sp. DT93 TaxID=3393428 RepID=UPI003CF33C92